MTAENLAAGVAFSSTFVSQSGTTNPDDTAPLQQQSVNDLVASNKTCKIEFLCAFYLNGPVSKTEAASDSRTG